ncbi:uncharacterized protein LOC117134721 [Drosophila busckii]|uniref:uncharacterized protein LOC117134721 n=1 Tax=Drosophila busckii TaxID=30019 RepID=UPI0014328BC3|nr:uncharacterized protein LOC117134721 [Drosophila busckii]
MKLLLLLLAVCFIAAVQCYPDSCKYCKECDKNCKGDEKAVCTFDEKKQCWNEFINQCYVSRENCVRKKHKQSIFQKTLKDKCEGVSKMCSETHFMDGTSLSSNNSTASTTENPAASSGSTTSANATTPGKASTVKDANNGATVANNKETATALADDATTNPTEIENLDETTIATNTTTTTRKRRRSKRAKAKATGTYGPITRKPKKNDCICKCDCSQVCRGNLRRLIPPPPVRPTKRPKKKQQRKKKKNLKKKYEETKS